MPQRELDDIQGLVFFGYGGLKHARYVFLQIHDAAAGRTWLRAVAGETTSAVLLPRDRRAATSQNIAFTAPGLQALGLGANVLGTFPAEFCEGMAQPRRSRILGDCVGSDPARWEIGGPGNTPHVLLLLFAKNGAGDDGIETLFARHRERWEQTRGGVTLMAVQETIPLGETEHFGFRDGISSVAIRGAPVAPRPGETPVAPGEFVLGYPNEYQKLPFAPSVAGADDADDVLPAAPDEPNRRKDLGRNGTFLVYRKLRQDVVGFWRFCDEQTRNPDNSPNPSERTRLAAKIVGRWPSGAPLVLCPDNDDPALGGDPDRNNDFRFAQADAQGLRCPLGAHIRRSNPRDSLAPGPAESLVMVNRHRLLRRGRPYGALLLDPLTESDDGGDRGLIFICLNANIARQFEFVQQTWLNDPTFHGLYDNKDPLVGDNRDGSLGTPVFPGPGDIPCRFTIPELPVRRRINHVPRFVHVRGGGYFFLPGLRALRFLSRGSG